MARYASGKHAYGISDRSGFRYRLSEMITEWNGLKVGPDEYEPKHPQLEPISPGSDPQALFEPRPDTSTEVAGQRLLIKNAFQSGSSGSAVVTVYLNLLMVAAHQMLLFFVKWRHLMGFQKLVLKRLPGIRSRLLTMTPIQSPSQEEKQQQSVVHEAAVTMRPLGQQQLHQQQRHRPLMRQMLHLIRQLRLLTRAKWQNKQ